MSRSPEAHTFHSSADSGPLKAGSPIPWKSRNVFDEVKASSAYKKSVNAAFLKKWRWNETWGPCPYPKARLLLAIGSELGSPMPWKSRNAFDRAEASSACKKYHVNAVFKKMKMKRDLRAMSISESKAAAGNRLWAEQSHALNIQECIWQGESILSL
jgi:hypothetical protein